jgi:opacity protein-like surface antigen
MRKQTILMAVFAFSGWLITVNAQDMIILKDGNIIEAKVMEIHPTEIRYKRSDNLDGPMIILPVSSILSIRYKNGTTDIINASPVSSSSLAGQAANQLSGTSGSYTRQNFLEESLQTILNAFPAIPIAGNNLKFLFSRERWTATVNGENYLAGSIETEETGSGYLLKLSQTHIWPGAVGKSVGKIAQLIPGAGAASSVLNIASSYAGSLVGAVEMSGPLYILEYISGPGAKLSFLRTEKAEDASPQTLASASTGREQSGETRQTYDGNKKPFEFSIGLGACINYMFIYTKYSDGYDIYENSWLDIGAYGSLGAELFSYVLFDVSFLLNHRSFDSGGSWNGSRMDIYLFGKYPFHLNSSLNLYPLIGLGYNIYFPLTYDNGEKISREDLKDWDELYLKIGGGLDWNLSKHFRFNIKLLYSVFLYSEGASFYEDYSIHGPNLLLGVRFVF